MNATTRLSAKGQIVIPKDVRTRHAWLPGTEFEVITRPDGILLRPAEPQERKLSWEEFRARVPKHEGPPISLEEMDAAVDRMFANQWNPKTGRIDWPDDPA